MVFENDRGLSNDQCILSSNVNDYCENCGDCFDMFQEGKPKEHKERQLITNFHGYMRTAYHLAEMSDWIRIVTFGMFITPEIEQFFEDHKDKDIEVLISYYFNECTPNCPHCFRKNQSAKANYNRIVKKFPEVKFSFVTECHAKLFITQNGAMVGGMNFSKSGWDDFVIVLKDDSDRWKPLIEFYNRLVRNKYKVDQFDIEDENIITFGKYRGKNVKEVQKEDPGYINWCKKNVDGFSERYNI